MITRTTKAELKKMEKCSHELNLETKAGDFINVDLAVSSGLNVHVRCKKCPAVALTTIYAEEIDWETPDGDELPAPARFQKFDVKLTTGFMMKRNPGAAGGILGYSEIVVIGTDSYGYIGLAEGNLVHFGQVDLEAGCYDDYDFIPLR